MKSFIRTVAFLLVAVLLLSVLSGCRSNGDMTDTQENTAQQELQPNQTESKKPEKTPKELLNLNGYCIVIPDGTTDVSVESLSAYELKATLAELGYSVSVNEDEGSDQVGVKSILLGKTAATVGNMPTGNKFSVSEKNEQIQISASNYYGYRAALDFLKSKITEAGGLPRDLNYVGSATVSHTSRATSNSIRVMFYNLNGFAKWQGNSENRGALSPSVALRQDLQRDMLSAYAPDVIGFQEYMDATSDGDADSYADYRAGFASTMTSLGYMQVETDTASCTPQFYNPLKLRVVESDSFCFTRGDADETASASWAVFEVVTSDAVGKLFAVFGTQLINDCDDLTDRQAEEARVHNATELIGAVNEVTAKYEGIAVIVGGDLNDPNLEAEGGTYETLKNGGLTYMAEPGGNAPAESTNRWKADGEYSAYTESYHGFYGYDVENKIYDMTENTLTTARFTLDYIFLGGNKDAVTVKKFIIINDELTYRASDHSPTFVDLILK